MGELLQLSVLPCHHQDHLHAGLQLSVLPHQDPQDGGLQLTVLPLNVDYYGFKDEDGDTEKKEKLNLLLA